MCGLWILLWSWKVNKWLELITSISISSINWHVIIKNYYRKLKAIFDIIDITGDIGPWTYSLSPKTINFCKLVSLKSGEKLVIQAIFKKHNAPILCRKKRCPGDWIYQEISEYLVLTKKPAWQQVTIPPRNTGTRESDQKNLTAHQQDPLHVFCVYSIILLNFIIHGILNKGKINKNAKVVKNKVLLPSRTSDTTQRNKAGAL